MITLANKFAHPTKGFELDPLTLARHLGRVVRFGGALNTYYTVLQHSLFVSEMAGLRCRERSDFEQDTGKILDPMRLGLFGLLHDAHEFLTGDVPTDWKTDSLREVQEGLDFKIREALEFHCSGPPWPSAIEAEIIKRCDHEALLVEANYVSPHCLEVLPSKFNDPSLVDKWQDVFRKYYCPDPRLAFERNWFVDGVYVKMFVTRFESFT